jgi:drug/metabolite transporter (DMT)-like permease
LLCSGSKGFAFGLGEVLALSCAITGAFTLVYTAKYLQDMDPIMISVMQAGFCALFCIIFSLMFEGIPNLITIPMIGWGVIIYLAVGCTCLAYLFQNIALRHLPATFVALSLCSEPIFTAIASYFLLGELLSAKRLFGAALILFSIIMVSLLPEELRDVPDETSAYQKGVALELLRESRQLISYLSLNGIKVLEAYSGNIARTVTEHYLYLKRRGLF